VDVKREILTKTRERERKEEGGLLALKGMFA